MQDLPYYDLTAGADVQPLLTASNGVKLAVAVCYEDAYGSEALYAFPGADVLINVSNDAWFGDSIAPHQHLQIARMRALEVGRYAVRSTNTGISAFIGPDGDSTPTSAIGRFRFFASSSSESFGYAAARGFSRFPVLRTAACSCRLLGFHSIEDAQQQ